MALNLLKLCVGAESVEDLEDWIARRLDEKRRLGQPAEHFHTTRMVPKRVDELVDGGSLYWVVKGKINRDIGDILGASPATVKKHLERIFAKLGVETRTAAAGMALGRIRQLHPQFEA